MSGDRGPTASSDIWGLTPRQVDVLRLLARGCSNVAIAGSLGLSLKSVENLINGIYQALGLASMDADSHPRVKAALIYLGRGGVEESSGNHSSQSGASSPQ